MGTKIEEQVERCVEELGAGTLTASSLRRIAELQGASTVQDILYLQATTTSPTSEIVGMRIIENGEISDGPHDPDDWPYQTVLEAVRDGWRVIKVPRARADARRLAHVRAWFRIHPGEGGQTMRQYDCEPTLNDTEVLEFCKNGFMMFEGVVSDEINRRTNDYLDEHDGMEPTDILDEDWFMDGVIKHPAVAGALRSLLGKDFGLPNLVSNHRIQCPQPAQEWHYDGGDIFGPQLNYIQVFYYPQDCPRELGPTELLPGSHFLYSERDMTKHLGRIRGSYHAVSRLARSSSRTTPSGTGARSRGDRGCATTSSTTTGVPRPLRVTGWTNRASTSPRRTTHSTAPPSGSSSRTATTPPRCTSGSGASTTSSSC